MSVISYLTISYKVSELFTKQYSTSFSIATSFLEREQREAIYSIYGLVRITDEVVDSFHDFDKAYLLDKLTGEINYALLNGISTNALVASFAHTFKKYQISRVHLDDFLKSMRADLTKKDYVYQHELDQYIHGSADVVGLMCLSVFCNGNKELYGRLEPSARKFGHVLQKVNFLRDLNSDMGGLGRSYFPELTDRKLDVAKKKEIEQSIEIGFRESWPAIPDLPGRAKLSVALVYFTYKELFNKIRLASPEKLMTRRIRISNARKWLIYVKVWLMYVTRLF